MNLKNNLINLSYQTEILESLGWDENQLNTLYEYLDTVFNEDMLTHPDAVLKIIEDNFGYSCKIIIDRLFKEVAVINNLHMPGGNVDN